MVFYASFYLKTHQSELENEQIWKAMYIMMVFLQKKIQSIYLEHLQHLLLSEKKIYVSKPWFW